MPLGRATQQQQQHRYYKASSSAVPCWHALTTLYEDQQKIADMSSSSFDSFLG
eukprot:COSAG01_NODE_206_length_22034_cov_125.512585_9_plen_53_part_00